MADDRLRLPRALHPLAWWLWALGLATGASRATNPLVLALVVAVVCWVVAARRTDAPWARSFRSFLFLGGLIIAIRVVFYAIVGNRFGTHRLVTLPEVALPRWAAGVRLGGPITLEGLLTAAFDGGRLATLMICLGAANTLANPRRLLRCVPGGLYEVGTAVVVALSVGPQLLESVQRVRRARRLRGATDSGLRALRGIAVPVLADALDHALALAASMDSRGYGRSGGVAAPVRRVTGAAIVLGLMGVCVGVYALLDGTTDARLGVPVLVAGLAIAVAGLVVGGRRVRPTSYRPDPWAWPEWVVAGSGIAAAIALFTAGAVDPDALSPSLVPLTWPTLAVLPAVGVLVALAPAWAAPPVRLPASRASVGERVGEGVAA
ncbi:MAG: CbiQ family ECF transporter T component [Acidimicrobiales bacterium]